MRKVKSIFILLVTALTLSMFGCISTGDMEKRVKKLAKIEYPKCENINVAFAYKYNKEDFRDIYVLQAEVCGKLLAYECVIGEVDCTETGRLSCARTR